MLAAGSAGNSRAEILKALNFGDAFEGDAKKNKTAVNVPFEAYRNIITRLQTQPEKGYILDIGKCEIKLYNLIIGKFLKFNIFEV